MSLRHKIPFRTGELLVANLGLEIDSASRRAILDLEQVAPLVDGRGGAPQNVYNRWRVHLES